MRRRVLATAFVSCGLATAALLFWSYLSWVELIYAGMACSYGVEAARDPRDPYAACRESRRAQVRLRWVTRGSYVMFAAFAVTGILYFRARRATQPDASR